MQSAVVPDTTFTDSDMDKKLLEQCSDMSDAETVSPKSLARLRSLSTMSSFARSFSRLTTSLLECPDVDEEEEQEFNLVVKATFLEYIPVKSRLKRCESDSVLVQPGSLSVDPADGNILRATESETVLPEGMPSVGSMLHESQQCRPCAWFWKPTGCSNGSACRHCHLCPAGELTRQRKVHRCMARQRRQDQGTSCGAQTVSIVPVLLPVMPSVIGISPGGPGPVQFCEPRAAAGSSSSNPTLLGRI
ncbi:unnamed protein product [Cladocopium goreaui]|uniref:C3H1-type domain-containing protein n=1 Tax=Cladocopium goreaui TaxID=2562237 RepID=A0A9P1M6C7_9DINO|nr:unnamed protein product [Cladocopium goreaui]